MGSILDKAIVYAVQAHSGMVRKGTALPYILHPLEAAAIVATMTDDEEVIAAAVLHGSRRYSGNQKPAYKGIWSNGKVAYLC